MKKFKKLYCLPNHRIRENTNMTYFLFCGSNWEYYFTRKSRDNEMECIENTVLTSEYNSKNYINTDFDNPGVYLQYI